MSTKSSSSVAGRLGFGKTARPRLIVPTSFIRYQEFRYLRWSLVLLTLAVAAYLLHRTDGPPNGGTWLGYTLGVVSAGLIVWLMWLGITKRRYAATGRLLQGWTSAHVYFGLVLLILVPLHSGFQFGWNVHTLAYALMCAVIGTGAIGVIMYGTLPVPMSRNRGGQKIENLLQQIADVDAECKAIVCDLPDEYARAVASAIDGTRIGGGLRRQLANDADTAATTEARKEIGSLQRKGLGDSRRSQQLVKLLSLKETLLDRIQRHIQYRSLLDLWLVLHVPLSFATLAVVLIHVFVVFYYW